MAEPDPTTPPVLAPAPIRTPVIDRTTLLVTRPWATYLDLSWRRQGGPDAPSNAELETDLDATQEELDQTQQDLAATQAELDQTQQDLASTQAALAATQAALDQTQQDLTALQAEFAAQLPDGAPLSVARYQADGSGVEASPSVVVDASGNLGVGTTTPTGRLSVVGGDLTVQRSDGQGVTVLLDAPTVVQRQIQWRTNGLNRWFLVASADAELGSNQGTHLDVRSRRDDGTALQTVLRFERHTGNLLFRTLSSDATGRGLLVVANGTAPGTPIANATSLWSANRGGVAGKGSLHLQAADGTSHVFGDRVGIGTLTPSSTLSVVGAMNLDLSETPPSGTAGQSNTYSGILTADSSTAVTALSTVAAINQAGFTHSGFPAVRGLQAIGRASGASGIVTSVAGVSVTASNTGAGTITNAYGYYATFANTGGGTISTASGFIVPAGVESAATTFYGLALSVAAAANKWNLYCSGSAPNYLRGNLGIGTVAFGAGLDRGLALGAGSPPTSSPVNTVQLWAADRGGVANKMSPHFQVEDGTKHVLGDLVGLGTALTATLDSGASYQALTVNGSTLYVGASSVQERPMTLVGSTWATSTDASRKARLTLSVYDHLAAREGLRLEASGTAALLSFHGVAAVARQAVPAAAADATSTQNLVNSIRTALINYGLCV